MLGGREVKPIHRAGQAQSTPCFEQHLGQMDTPLTQDSETLLKVARSISIVRQVHGGIPKPEEVESAALTLVMIGVVPIILDGVWVISREHTDGINPPLLLLVTPCT